MLRKHTLTILYWLIILLLTVLTIYVLVKLFPTYKNIFRFIMKVLLPFIISCIIAYLLYPIVKKIESYRVQTFLAILIIYLFFFGGIGLFTYYSLPMLVSQLQELNEQLPELINLYENFINKLYDTTSFLPINVQEQIDLILITIEKKIEALLGKVIGSITRIFDLIILLTVIPVLVFYFLKDYKKIKRYSINLIPKKHVDKVLFLVKGIDQSLGNYIRGQLIVCFFIAVTAWITFEIIGIDYGIILGLIMGLTNIIPYFGPLIGTVPAILIAATQSMTKVIFVIVASFIIQLLENNFLSPYIVGKSVNIHPIGIIFALLIGGQLGGIIGMIVAVPLLTIGREMIRSIRKVQTID